MSATPASPIMAGIMKAGIKVKTHILPDIREDPRFLIMCDTSKVITSEKKVLCGTVLPEKIAKNQCLKIN